MEKIIKYFIKDYLNYEDARIREQYGILCSSFFILCNLFMVIFKLLFGYLTGSIAIVADGLNNFSDLGSNFAVLFSFKLANKHPDSDHPYGHGRIEYIMGIVISFFIIITGLNILKESFIRIIKPEDIEFSFAAAFVLLISIFLKLLMAYIANDIGKKVNSPALLASSQDSINDVFTTLSTLISFILILFMPFKIDGFVGFILSLFILKSGIEIFKDMLNMLLGKAPSKELIKELVDYIMSHSKVIGIHDMMLHDYGPSRKYMTFHAEVDASGDLKEIHDEIDLIERELLEKYGILTTIHMDPIDINDEKTKNLREIVLNIVKELNAEYNIHDFRIVSGKTHTNLIFDVVIPSSDKINHEEVKKAIIDKINQLDDTTYYCIIDVEHAFIEY